MSNKKVRPDEVNDEISEEQAYQAGEQFEEAENAFVEKKESSQTEDSTEKLQEEMDALKDQNLRVLAEYDNYKKRTNREKQEIYRIAEFDTILQILPIFDNLERGMETTGSDENVRKGIEMIYNQGHDVLAKMGVTEIEAMGQSFDPELYNAVMHVEDPGFGENTVIEVLQKGYKKDDKVIRHAMVKVAN